MASGKRIPQQPCSALSLSWMAVLSVGIIGCQDTPTDVTEAEVQLSVGGASVAALADAYVDDDNAGGTEDGTSWATAFGNLNDALASATDVDGDGAISIWIAGGTYVPTAVYSPGGVEGGAYGEEARSGSGLPLAQYEADRDAGFLNTFYLADGVRLYGGFRGLSGGGDANDRDTPTFRTILSGDVKGNDKLKRDHPRYRDFRADNVWHVTSAGNDTPTLGGGAVLMDGLTIEGGDAVDAPVDGVPGFVWIHRDGGGLYAGGSDVSLNDLVVRRNESSARGGGIVLRNQTTHLVNFVATHSTFHDNHAGDPEVVFNGCCGGAISLVLGIEASTGLIENSTFTENTAGAGGAGAVAASNATMTVRNSHFERNRVGHAGGALQGRGGENNWLIEDNTFIGNFAADRGGAVDMLGEMVLRHNVFMHNRADAQHLTLVGGGAVSGLGNQFGETPVDIIEDNDFEGNTSASVGGAILLWTSNGPAQNPDGPPQAVVNGNTFHDNHAADFGGAIDVESVEATIEDNNFEGNTSGFGGAISFFSLNGLLGGPAPVPWGPPSEVVNGNTFHDNHAAEIGGAIEVEGVEISMDDNIYTHNSAQVAGGALGFFNIAPLLESVVLFDLGGSLHPVVATVSNSHFADNWVEGEEAFVESDVVLELHHVPGGGAISMAFGADITLTNSSFEENSAHMGDGGAIKNGGSFGIDDPFGFFGDGPNKVGSTDVLTITNSTFANNEATEGNGGAISSGGVPDPAFEDATTFDSFKDHYDFNTAGGNGGALYFKSATGELKKAQLKDNDADGLGDSMYLEGSSIGLKNVKIEGEDGDDVVIVAGSSSPTAAGVSGLAGGAPAVGSAQTPRTSRLPRRWNSLLCVKDLRQLSLETGTLECSIDGSGR